MLRCVVLKTDGPLVGVWAGLWILDWSVRRLVDPGWECGQVGGSWMEVWAGRWILDVGRLLDRDRSRS